MADFEYFRAEESDQFSFFRIPKALFTEKEFASLSTDAKLLYGILLDRISLSKKNGWIDSDGYVYIIYTIAELQWKRVSESFCNNLSLGRTGWCQGRN